MAREEVKRRLRAVSTHVVAGTVAAEEPPEFWARLDPPPQPPSDSAVTAITSQVREEGWVVVPDVIPADEIAAVRESVMATWQAHQETPSKYMAGSFLNINTALAPYLTHELVLGVAEQLWGPRGIKLTSVSPVPRFPGSKRDGRYFHSDWPYNTHQHAVFVPEPYPVDVPMHLTTIFMLSPFTEENATWIVPRSHRQSRNYLHLVENAGDALPAGLQAIQGVGNEGSVLIFDSRLYHGAPDHTAPMPRVGVGVRYAPWWLNILPLIHGSAEREALLYEGKPEANVIYPMHREVFMQLPTALQQLTRHLLADK